MTREEAIVLFEKQLTAAQVVLDSGFGSNPGENDSLYRRRKEMAEIALSALRLVSREQVEKVWRGEWKPIERLWKYSHQWQCSRCGQPTLTDQKQFCDFCGAPMTDEAVQILIERMEELKDES